MCLLQLQDAGYLALERFPRHSENCIRNEDCPDAEDLQEGMKPAEEDADCAVLALGRPRVHLYDYHIAYHPSYCVPVLLFQGQRQGGVPTDTCC